MKFHDGHPLTTADVKWTYENYKGLNFKIFRDKLDHIEIVDDRTIIFHFKEPFVDFLDLFNGASNGIGWIVPKHYYEQVGKDGFKTRPIGAGPFKFVNQEVGVQMAFEAWEEYWRRPLASRLSASRASGIWRRAWLACRPASWTWPMA